ncbi:MAG: proline dehydrogenase family protein [Sphingobacteriales bacterium]|nr:proline dehydrogenase family protein [Sphingobacteriales bacterium]
MSVENPKNTFAALSFDNTQTAFEGKTDTDLKHAYRLFSLMNNPALVRTGSMLTEWAFRWQLPIQAIVRHTIFEQFCGGETMEQCKKPIEKLAQYSVKTILDYGAEAKENEEEFEKTAQFLVKNLRYATDNQHINIISSKITGLLRFELLEKVSAGKELTKEENEEWLRGKRRVKFVSRAAYDADVCLYFDAEESWIQAAIDQIVTEMMAFYNKEKPLIYNTVQLYRHDRLAFLKESYEKARQGSYFYAVKLVRGAYMEKERERALAKGYPSPIQPNKAATDRDYNAALLFCLQHIKDIALCNATHNEESCLYLCQLMQEMQLPPHHIHVITAQLYGMSDHISFNMAKAGYSVAKYMPYGPVKEVVPYLIRRAKENTSVSGQMGRELSLLKKEMERRKLL